MPANNENVGPKRDQTVQPGICFCQRERDSVGRQEQTLRVGELGTPPKSVLHDCTPEINLAVNTAILVAELAEVPNVLRRIHAASAVRVREFVSAMHGFHTGSASNSLAFRRQRPTRKPRLAVERRQPSGVPPPNAVSDYRRDVVGNIH